MNDTRSIIPDERLRTNPFRLAAGQIDAAMAERLLQYEPFASLDHSRFPRGRGTIADLLCRFAALDCLDPGAIVYRRGTFTSSAGLILRGQARLLLADVDQHPSASRRKSTSDSLWHRMIASVRGGRARRSPANPTTRLMLQDFADVFDRAQPQVVGVGQLIADLAVMMRTPLSYSVVAETPLTILYLPWQILREIRRDKSFLSQIEQRFRQQQLPDWLRNHPLTCGVPDHVLPQIAERVVLRTFGDPQWYAAYKADRQSREAATESSHDASPSVEEALVAAEGHDADTLYLVRHGFARNCYSWGSGRRTESYLSVGSTFGWNEIAHNARLPQTEQTACPLPLQSSLYAVGYLDVMALDAASVRELILPYVAPGQLPRPLEHPRYDAFGDRTAVRDELLPSLAMTDWTTPLVDHRLINARSALVIDLNRCVRCDDCVRACAAAHDGVARFEREGISIGSQQIIHACMHCVDPVCMIGCPTGAIARDGDAGVVDIDPEKCIGCGICAEACPYDNIVVEQLVDASRTLPVATKCDLCHRLPTGPACVTACPHTAIERVDLSRTPRPFADREELR